MRAQTPVKIRVGVAVVESFSQGTYAQELGYYTRAGLDADVQTLTNGGTLTAALLGGSLDFATTNGGSMANAYVRGLPIYCIIPSGLYSSTSPTTVLAVAKDSPIQAARDLAGKRIAVTTLRDLAAGRDHEVDRRQRRRFQSVELRRGPERRTGRRLLAQRTDATALLDATDRPKTRSRSCNAYDSLAKRFMISGWIVTKEYTRRIPRPYKFVAVSGRPRVGQPQSARRPEILAKQQDPDRNRAQDEPQHLRHHPRPSPDPTHDRCQRGMACRAAGERAVSAASS